jgi:hypothetical protein
VRVQLVEVTDLRGKPTGPDLKPLGQAAGLHPSVFKVLLQFAVCRVKTQNRLATQVLIEGTAQEHIAVAQAHTLVARAQFQAP